MAKENFKFFLEKQRRWLCTDGKKNLKTKMKKQRQWQHQWPKKKKTLKKERENILSVVAHFVALDVDRHAIIN